MTVAERLEALIIDLATVPCLDPREDFKDAEVGLSFDGRLIYSREALVECFTKRQCMTEMDAEEWIDFNIVGAGQVLVVD